MKRIARCNLKLIPLAAALLFWLTAHAQAQQQLSVFVTPQTVAIGSFYDGATVSVAGEVPTDAQALVRLTGVRQDIHLKKKGKVFGLLWMNLDTLAFDDVPNVYRLYTSMPFEKLVGQSSQASPAWKLGLSSLEDEIRINPESVGKDLLFQEFLKLKQSEGLYGVSNDAIRYTKTVGDRKTFEARLDIPSRVPPGQYNVEVYAIKDGNIVGQTNQALKVELDGFPAMISTLAFQHSAVFGILATMIALFAGLLMGFIFGSGKGGH